MRLRRRLRRHARPHRSRTMAANRHRAGRPHMSLERPLHRRKTPAKLGHGQPPCCQPAPQASSSRASPAVPPEPTSTLCSGPGQPIRRTASTSSTTKAWLPRNQSSWPALSEKPTRNPTAACNRFDAPSFSKHHGDGAPMAGLWYPYADFNDARRRLCSFADATVGPQCGVSYCDGTSLGVRRQPSGPASAGNLWLNVLAQQ